MKQSTQQKMKAIADLIVWHWGNGCTPQQIADEFGVHHGTIRSFLKRKNLYADLRAVPRTRRAPRTKQERRRERLRMNDLCPICGGPSPDWDYIHCESCRKKRQVLNRKSYRRKRNA